MNTIIDHNTNIDHNTDIDDLFYSNAACFSSGLYLKHTGACSGPQVD